MNDDTVSAGWAWSQWLGPQAECILYTFEEWESINDRFWELIMDLLDGESSNYDDLPDWMTEVATEQLSKNQ